MNDRANRICPVEKAGGLDNRIRRWLQDPYKILGPYIEAGMTVLDVGCGPGFFSIEMARMVGPSGQVIAADQQDGMLEILRNKVAGTKLEERITLHKCEKNGLGVATEIDFALAFYMVHEVPDQDAFFREMATMLKPGGGTLVVEPPFHVSRTAFRNCVAKAQAAGLELLDRPKVRFSKTALLVKS